MRALFGELPLGVSGILRQVALGAAESLTGRRVGVAAGPWPGRRSGLGLPDGDAPTTNSVPMPRTCDECRSPDPGNSVRSSTGQDYP